MPEMIRVEQEPAWLLHHRAFRDTSRILDLLTRGHGRISVVARGSRSAKSKLRGLLRPFLPLSVGWVARSELGTLTGAEINGPPLALSGDALLSGYYVNELLLNLMHRHDPQPEIFDAYATTIRLLSNPQAVAPILRRFEIELLRMLGYALGFDRDYAADLPVMDSKMYEYVPAQGPRLVDKAEGPMVFPGSHLLRMASGDFDSDQALLSVNRLMRGVIAYHLDGKELKSRKVLRDIRQAGKTGTRQAAE